MSNSVEEGTGADKPRVSSTTKKVAAGAAAVVATGAVSLNLVLGGWHGRAVVDPPVEESTANIWTEVGGGTCAGGSSSTPITYEDAASPDRICGPPWDTCWDAMSAGQTCRIKNGTYGRQFITGDKASTTKIIGESKAGVIISDTTADCYAAFGAGTILCADGNNLWLENITADAGSEDGSAAGSLIAGQNVTYKNVDIIGDFPDISVGNVVAECTGCDATGFTWDGGTYGDVAPPKRPCIASPGNNGEPVWVYFPNVTIKGITFNKQWVELEISNGGPCAEGDNAHLEFIRLESNADNLTVINNTFLPNSDAGSGYIFYSVSTIDNLKIIGNFFADDSGTTWMQSADSTCSLVIAYNTFSGNDGVILGCSTITWVGNLGATAPGCAGTHIKNVWSGSGTCGTDTYVGATNLDVSATDGTLGASSPAIDAGEIPDASDYCTNPAYVNSIDRYGTVRPQLTACTAGSYERS